MSPHGTLLPRANAAACPQPTKADFAASPRRVRERQRIAALDDMLVEAIPEALASRACSPLGAARPASMAMSALGGRRHAGVERGVRILTHSGQVTDRAMDAWYDPSMHE
jgi:hypothetical protein